MRERKAVLSRARKQAFFGLEEKSATAQLPYRAPLIHFDANFDDKNASMSQKKQAAPYPRKRRTTLTLPSDSLIEAQRIARTRNMNLSTVVWEAFAGFSDDEISILDGVILDEPLGNGR
ncbi:MAG TPA: hypothetical protein VK789_07495 [Bryobacteraceae bacterium]|nr:hypothetical protein [Bryobacteraceae bacterium]